MTNSKLSQRAAPRRDQLDRDRRVAQTTVAGQLSPRPSGPGQAWINGRKVGGTDARFAHLYRLYD
jgi:hypothetical protein